MKLPTIATQLINTDNHDDTRAGQKLCPGAPIDIDPSITEAIASYFQKNTSQNSNYVKVDDARSKGPRNLCPSYFGVSRLFGNNLEAFFKQS